MVANLQFEPMQQEIHIGNIKRIDKQILGHVREPVHRWIATTRSGSMARRNGEAVGYGYLSDTECGPIALMDEEDTPAVLAHAESFMAERGEEFGLETPLSNRQAIKYFAERRCRMGSFTVLFMSNQPFGRSENYFVSAPSSLCDKCDKM